jgi:O-antigen/teichoic acid export membrane protein
MHSRDRQLKQHILGGAAFQVASIGLALLAMPLMLKMLGQASLGVWLTLLSIFQWLTFFDLGIASGARNALSRAIAEGDTQRARSLVTTAYWYTALITLVTVVIFLTVYFACSVNNLFAGSGTDSRELALTVMISLVLVAINLVLGLVHQLYAAFEKPATIPFSGFLANLLFVMFLVSALLAGNDSMVLLAVLYGASLSLTRLTLTLRFFRAHAELLPAWRYVDTGLKGELFSFGLKIFVIQLCAMVLFTTDKLLISWLLAPADVVNYESGFRIFALISMFHALVMNSYWSSFTHAASHGEWDWIRRTLRMLIFMMLPVIALSLLLIALSPALITLWMGAGATSGNSLYQAFAAYTVLSCWSNIFAYFVNGIGRVNLQLVSAIIAAGINIPLSIMFVRSYDLGITGIVLATVISLGLFSVLGPLQTRRILAESEQ